MIWVTSTTSDAYPQQPSKAMPESKEQVLSVIKEYASPLLLSIIGMLIWRDLSELRDDVKLLLIQQSQDHVKIKALESDVRELKASVFEFERIKAVVKANHPTHTQQ